MGITFGTAKAVPFPLVLLEQKGKSLPNVAKKAPVESGTRTQPLPERGIIF